MAERMKAHLVDGSFFPRERSATLSGERSGECPQSFEWIEGPHPYWHADGYGDYTFYTDMCLEQAIEEPGRKVAWLLEPPWKIRHYKTAEWLSHRFDYILTYWREMPGNALFYPLGGSWIKEWGVFPKEKLCSLIASDKAESEGHNLRHRIARRFAGQVDLMGRGYRPIESKAEGLRPYHYSIVVESWRGDWYFSEKLIDCLSQGTIPIYWGCPSIGKFFDTGGILTFETLDELGDILAGVSEEAYQARLPAIRANLETARGYQCAEDWIYRHYPFLFEGQ